MSDQRWDLQLEVGPPIRGGLCMWGHTGAPMLHVGISYSFEKKKRLFIVDYIKPSPVYQVKCKLVVFGRYFHHCGAMTKNDHATKVLHLV